MAEATGTVQGTKLDESAEVFPAKEVRLRARHWEIFRKNILWRVVSSLISAILVLATLYVFAAMANVDTWERRWFNMLTIFFSSLVSFVGWLPAWLSWWHDPLAPVGE
jgi:hypothetical protein